MLIVINRIINSLVKRGVVLIHYLSRIYAANDSSWIHSTIPTCILLRQAQQLALLPQGRITCLLSAKQATNKSNRYSSILSTLYTPSPQFTYPCVWLGRGQCA